MCGIAGLWRRGKLNAHDGLRLEKMSGAIAHRGPDDYGYLLADSRSGLSQSGQTTAAPFAPDVLLSSRRLAILDLTSEARQPLANEAGDVFVVFNGAIHNYIELREQLQARGHVFRTHTDTEIIVHAYEEWDADCARRFNGMWAYAIWDGKNRRLVCSRDRFGIKPLLLAHSDKTFYFASEAKAIFAGSEIEPVPDWTFLRRTIIDEVPEYTRRTAFANITQLPPGHNLVVTEKGQWGTAFWSYEGRSQQYDFSRPLETFRELLADAVRLRMRADTPVALLLSGGLDSSSIAAFARESSGQSELPAFTYTVPGFQNDEWHAAQSVARKNGLTLHGVEVAPSQFSAILSRVVWHMEDPPRHAQVIARWQLLQAAGQSARIVLEGQGADELLGGYGDRYRTAYLRDAKARMATGDLLLRLPHFCSAYFGLGDWRNRSLRRALHLKTPAQEQWSADVLAPEISNQRDFHEPVEYHLQPHFSDALTQQLWRDHAHLLLPYLLHFGDALSMAHAVESRLPFLDHRLVEFAFALPYNAKICGRTTKQILRRALGDKLPRAISRSHSKIGFVSPLPAWIAANLNSEIRPRLLSVAREHGVFNAAKLEQCLSAFEAGDSSMAVTIFRALALGNWYEQFLGCTRFSCPISKSDG